MDFVLVLAGDYGRVHGGSGCQMTSAKLTAACVARTSLIEACHEVYHATTMLLYINSFNCVYSHNSCLSDKTFRNECVQCIIKYEVSTVTYFKTDIHFKVKEIVYTAAVFNVGNSVEGGGVLTLCTSHKLRLFATKFTVVNSLVARGRTSDITNDRCKNTTVTPLSTKIITNVCK